MRVSGLTGPPMEEGKVSKYGFESVKSFSNNHLDFSGKTAYASDCNNSFICRLSSVVGLIYADANIETCQMG
ncbi:hypothetical protein L1987_60937 [Smallanthus sonchifolius]|uniref:Uncharacterized protein n=1 Tax=Smallanthus sonchifolius TaxID=185202 RepID=A0ACB9DAC8_9ASTR|nr:hypothetical protein L1987_60937 [Smallanthus sonchifolius]